MSELAVDLYGQRIGLLSGDNVRSFDHTIDPSAIAHFGSSSQVMSMAGPLDAKRSRHRRNR